MATLIIPVEKSPNQTLNVDLEGQSYNIELRFNERDSGLRMGISSVTGEPLLLGRKLLLECSFLDQLRATPGLPPGDFFLSSEKSGAPDIAVENIGDTLYLLYTESNNTGS